MAVRDQGGEASVINFTYSLVNMPLVQNIHWLQHVCGAGRYINVVGYQRDLRPYWLIISPLNYSGSLVLHYSLPRSGVNCLHVRYNDCGYVLQHCVICRSYLSFMISTQQVNSFGPFTFHCPRGTRHKFNASLSPNWGHVQLESPPLCQLTQLSLQESLLNFSYFVFDISSGLLSSVQISS